MPRRARAPLTHCPTCNQRLRPGLVQEPDGRTAIYDVCVSHAFRGRLRGSYGTRWIAQMWLSEILVSEPLPAAGDAA